ncbi:MAG: UDP-N-acetylmuramate--L-alanine ligase, partial [Rhodoferax sp.]|nr:UDP-N-acetylmuramate--L-alanine ligase [Rhodoferax sp.]
MKHAIKHLHFIGIGGSGMSAIAEVLHSLGYTVSGSDIVTSATVRRLGELGIHVYPDHAAANVAGADAVVTSSAVLPDNVEVMEARNRRVPIVP